MLSQLNDILHSEIVAFGSEKEVVAFGLSDDGSKRMCYCLWHFDRWSFTLGRRFQRLDHACKIGRKRAIRSGIGVALVNYFPSG